MNDVYSKPWLLPKQQAAFELRRRLWASGYRPVPVYGPEVAGSSPGKRPCGDDWTGRARQNPPEAATSAPKNDALNTGVLCDGLRAVDVDIDDAETAEVTVALAVKIFGPAPMRFRTNSPRRLLLYRANGGEPPKRFVAGSKGKVEVLGRGQQFVAFGMHESGVEHHWAPLDFLDFHAKSLNVVSEAQVDQFLQEVAILIEAAPAKPAKKQKASEREHAYAAAALSNSFVELVSMGEGAGRNNALNGTA